MRSVVLVVTVLYISGGTDVFVDALHCYSCADSTADRRCQTDLDEMVEQALCINNTNNTDSDCKFRERFIENCTNDKPYCLLQKIESRGAVDAYIRTCSDGKTFYIKDVDGLTNIKPDNQTRFGYKETGYLLSVTLCAGNLCNGPTFTSGQTTTINKSILAILLPILCVISLV